MSAYGDGRNGYDPYEGQPYAPRSYDDGFQGGAGFRDGGSPRDLQDGRPGSGYQNGGYQDGGSAQGFQDGDLEHQPQHRGKGPKLIMAAAIGMVALIVVGAIAFTGSLLMSKTSNSSAPDTVAGAASTTDAANPLGYVSTDPNSGATPGATTEAATSVSPTPAKTTPAAPKTTQPGKPKTTAPGGGGAGGGGGGSNVAYENQVLTLVNAERAKANCKPLAYNAKLRAAAYKHSADMAAKNYFSHDSQDGTSFATRISNEGYRWGGAAENIAKGQQTPADVMKAWMNSAGHRANILNCGLKDLGVGLAYQGKTPIWTQDFGSPL